MTDEEELPDRLLTDLAGAPVIHEAEIDDYVAAGGSVHGRSRVDDALSPRELEALRYLSRGLTLDQTATAMICAHDTIKTRLKAARFKLRAKNTTHACCEAIRRGLIE